MHDHHMNSEKDRPSVWIVLQDETPDNTVLGVVESRSAAAAFSDEVSCLFPRRVLYAEYAIGYRLTDHSRSA